MKTPTYVLQKAVQYLGKHFNTCFVELYLWNTYARGYIHKTLQIPGFFTGWGDDRGKKLCSKTTVLDIFLEDIYSVLHTIISTITPLRTALLPRNIYPIYQLSAALSPTTYLLYNLVYLLYDIETLSSGWSTYLHMPTVYSTYISHDQPLFTPSDTSYSTYHSVRRWRKSPGDPQLPWQWKTEGWVVGWLLIELHGLSWVVKASNMMSCCWLWDHADVYFCWLINEFIVE